MCLLNSKVATREEEAMSQNSSLLSNISHITSLQNGRCGYVEMW